MGLINWLRRRVRPDEYGETSESAPDAQGSFDETLERALAAQSPEEQRTLGSALAGTIETARRGAFVGPAFEQIDVCLLALRKARKFAAIASFTDQVIARDDRSRPLMDGDEAAREERVRWLYARLFGPRGLRIRIHALIETGDLEQALRLSADFRSFFNADAEGLNAELREALGLRGRIFKQRYVDCADSGLFQPLLLKQSIEAYAEGYARTEPRSLWHGVNVLALIERARADGVELPESARFETGPLGADLLRLAQSPESAEDTWRHMSSAEVYWALRRFDEAEHALAQHVAETIARGEGVQEIESALRQLRHVWRIEEGRDGARGRALTAQLEVALGRATSTNVSQIPSAAGAAENGPLLTELDRRLNEARAEGAQMQTFEWVNVLQERGRAVGLICDRSTKRGYGTGFLVRGEDLSPAWEGKILLMTNFHVINATGGEVAYGVIARRPDQAEVVFSQTSDLSPIRLGQILWLSPVSAHDTCIVELARSPNGAIPIPVSSGGACDAVTVLGHAGGAQLRLAMENRTVLLTDRPTASGGRAICYAAPTSEGCSGGPVLDWYDLKLVGLHHRAWDSADIAAAFAQPRDRRNAAPAPGYVNEGILIASVIESIARQPEGVS